METPRDEKLAADLRALRPAPRPEFAAELDERAAAGFPRRSRWPRLSFSPRRVLIPAGGVAVIALAVTTIAIVISSGGGGSSVDLSMEPDSAAKHPHQQRSSEYSTETPAAPSAASAGAAAEVESGSSFIPMDENLSYEARIRHRAVERNAELVLGADPADVADDASKVFEAVHAHDGIVMRSSTREGEPGVAGARFELLIPSAKLSDALAALSGIDEVRLRHEATDDITAPTVQTGELLQDSKARIDSLLAQLEATETESEREAVEEELAAERRHRARLRAQLQHLERRADYSRVLVRIETGASHDSSSGGAWGIDDAMGDAGHILAVAAAVAVVALAILGPIALVALLAWLTHRAWIRRERRRVLS
ncbi:MAG TPA: DUF4349 domain-containing protein [Solirubrobacterales bacterium]|jgi:hypothetical protein|nr:DUF4349 domain-containing protein [Solirubrobacterales bacterium]